jgi:hypothetical protein
VACHERPWKQTNTTRKYFSIQRYAISEKKTLLFGKFAGLDHLFFWYEQRRDEDEYGAQVE